MAQEVEEKPMSANIDTTAMNSLSERLFREQRLERRVRYAGHFVRVLFVLLGFYGITAFYQQASNNAELQQFTTQAVFEGKGTTSKSILVVPISGVISGNPLNNGGMSKSSGLFSNSVENTVLSVRRALNQATKMPDLAEVVMFVESPGGELTASDEVYSMLKRWRKAHQNVRVSAYLYSIAASGAYYVAMAADTLAANPTSMVGSLGVITQMPNLSELAKRFGVDMTTVKSGEFKDVGNILREPLAEELAMLKKLVMHGHDRFVSVVDEGRPFLTRPQVMTLADGRVFSAEEAVSNGLIDQVSPTFDDFLAERAELIRKQEDFLTLQVVLPTGEFSLLDLLF